ncbi:hypothetical protein M8J75_005486 [Diaphorina citri]|nr:hypothetical protein M8J75_005486 [Diaphorina citri]KAI5717254.1 hypothetical protein M8J77_002752 [Diaphorina citri]
MKQAPSWIPNDELGPDEVYETRVAPPMESFGQLLKYCEDSLRPYRICPKFFCTYRKGMTVIEQLNRLRTLQHVGEWCISVACGFVRPGVRIV